MNLTDIRAFDYRPSFSTALIDHWRRFDGKLMRNELNAIKSNDPHLNAVRLTHSYDAYLRDEDFYLRAFDLALQICAELGLGVISCLFNRWHDKKLDCGGIYIENFTPGLSWAYKEGFFMPYLKDVCARHNGDERVVIWESCDKPFGVYTDFSKDEVDNYPYEKRWLREIYCYIKQTKARAPVGVSLREWFGAGELREIARSCDVFLRSPYYCNDELTDALFKREFPDTGKSLIDIGG